MVDSENEVRGDDVCEDCGAAVSEGKPGCLKMFEEMIAREFSDYRYGRIHRLTVDAYALQHPEPYMRSGKSFAAHLTGVCAALEYEDAPAINQAVQKWLSRNPAIDKPSQLPRHRGQLTITYVHEAGDAEEHNRRVREWARSVWLAWAEFHDPAKQLIKEATAAVD
ncbi:MAG: hypothetical protein QOD28_3746 [Acidobacteriota bacterium]|nr:hypothetical protein [Acidobacteriota bacterium]